MFYIFDKGENDMATINMAVLTKSSKFGNYCVAGINMADGSWVRLMTEDADSCGALSEADLTCKDGTKVQIFDVICVPIKGKCGTTVQPENVLIDSNEQIMRIRQTTLEEVLKIHPLEVRDNILGNEYPYVTCQYVPQVGYSLTIVEVEDLEIIQQENPSGKPKTKAAFFYKKTRYENMSVTDQNYYRIKSGTKIKKAIIVVSIGTPYKDHYYKFVSAIFVSK